MIIYVPSISYSSFLEEPIDHQISLWLGLFISQLLSAATYYFGLYGKMFLT